MELKALKSGSDIRGTALEGFSSPVLLTDEAVNAIVSGFVMLVKSKINDERDIKIGIGHDSRLSAERIKEEAIKALKRSGCIVFDAGLISTPCAYYMTKHAETDCDGAIMITASHHPKEKNGLKFFTKEGGISKTDLDSIIENAESGNYIEGQRTMLYRRDFLANYCQSLVDMFKKETGIELPLLGFKLCVDAGNGAGGFYADRVLKVLGADVSASQFLEPDGNFPNHVPNPEDADAMRSIAACVKANNADLGIIFDTDVDRAAIVAPDASEVNRNSLIALVSAMLLEDNKGATIVTDSVTSDGLTEFITGLGGVHHRFKRGYMNVISEAKRLNSLGSNAILAIETSGHAALKENNFLDDGAYLVTKILIKAAKLRATSNKPLMSLIEGLKKPLETAEIRVNITSEDFLSYGNTVLEGLKSFSESMFKVASSNYEGVRANVDYADGWFLVRMSVHDPVMPINIESNKQGGVKLIAKLLHTYLSSFKGIDCTSFIRYL